MKPAAAAALRLLLVRHAEVEADGQNIFGGRMDLALSPRGHEQAAVLADYLRRQPLDAIYASPMKRVQQTLAPLLARGAPPPVILPDLREMDFGDWTGLSGEAVQTRFGVSAWSWLEQIENNRIARAEGFAALRERVAPCLRRIQDEQPGRQVAVFCHGGIIRVVLALLLHWPLARLGAFEIAYASVTRVRLHPERVQLQLINYAPWREPGA
ncbi:MAG TPA: histidine phosphatase family protein [Verrucomicrobiota bacterium]|nr:histidine phosphatase family protein [Verrucomicrobiota bacterium]HRR63739.1 histidine phosphatase family protein [Candidatus Paceibacterota bacterium]HOM44700.1 histidine phosphatase family protein [Verrucomicrobiota bacterium]HOQ55201.1 histidine phosphatase family protein [Verrucomicrobiota bacterium]HPC52413.1 histidine phosphatase family protein [Verrucomicrobiota bacterium]